MTTDVGMRGDRRSVAASTARMKFLPADLMRQVPPGSALLLHGTLPPAHLVGRRPWEERRLQELAEGKAPAPEAVERSDHFMNALATKHEVSEFVLAHMSATPGLLMPAADDNSEASTDELGPPEDKSDSEPEVQLAPVSKPGDPTDPKLVATQQILRRLNASLSEGPSVTIDR